MNSIKYRSSVTDDKEDITALLSTCFGDREKYGAVDDLEGRYLLACDEDKIVAMTGLIQDSPDYNGNEIDWTCVLPEYRGLGLITTMMRDLLKLQTADVYCSCLRIGDNERINMYYAMQEFGFQCVVKEHKKFNILYDKVCLDCIHKNNKTCFCAEDLYVKQTS
jgi:predicted GNAT family N-acyltransferase